MGAAYDTALEPEGLETASVNRVSAISNVPSEVLLQRPDIASAEAQLKSANANIGVARAAFFPRITLTGFYGTSSSELSNLFDAGTKVWQFVPSVSLPIFAGGANVANLNAAKAQQKAALATYEGAIQKAFKDVADALATEGTVDEEQGLGGRGGGNLPSCAGTLQKRSRQLLVRFGQSADELLSTAGTDLCAARALGKPRDAL